MKACGYSSVQIYIPHLRSIEISLSFRLANGFDFEALQKVFAQKEVIYTVQRYIGLHVDRHIQQS